MIKRCIYHVPYPITDETNAASAIRPRKMLEAFQRNFDEVFVISGYGKERAKKFKLLKKRVTNGISYEFMYSENSTMPNLMTERNHLPLYPFLEKNIFRFCKRHDIPIGLFYRDIYWKFPVYKQKVNFWKRCITLPLYHYDLAIYNKYLSIMYLASGQVEKYVGYKGKMKPLPPGSGEKRNQEPNIANKNNKRLELFYVGGIGGNYDISKLIEGVRTCDFLHLTLCCHHDQLEEWSAEKGVSFPRNVTIIHKSGNELKKYFEKADLGILFFTSSGYWNMAMPVKLFEYIEHNLPVLATKNCAAGNFVEENDVGWTIDYSVKAFVELLSEINDNREQLVKKRHSVIEAAKNNTWDARAISVYRDLINL